VHQLSPHSEQAGPVYVSIVQSTTPARYGGNATEEGAGVQAGGGVDEGAQLKVGHGRAFVT
jgi:hypothetical protein